MTQMIMSKNIYDVEDSLLYSEIQLEQNSYDISGGTHFITTDNEAHLGNEGTTIGSSVEMVSQVEKNDKMTHSSGVQLDTVGAVRYSWWRRTICGSGIRIGSCSTCIL